MQAPAAPSSSSQSAQSTARRAVIGTASMSRAPCPSDGRCSASSRTGLLRASRSHRDTSTRVADAEVSTEIRVALDTGAAFMSPAKAISAATSGLSRTFPVDHIVVDMQENRSFDHYYGFAPFVPAPYKVPDGYSQPDGHGGSVVPYHFTSLSTPDIGHGWNATHGEWDSGKMDGFYTTDGIYCLGYYTADDLPFYYSLFETSTLCANYFCSLMGPTWPNRFYLAAGTSGGITTNGVWGYGVFDYPIILDLLEAAGVSWKVYNIGWDSVPYGNTDNVFVFWKRWAHDQRTLGSKGDYLNDLRLGQLPEVAFIIPSYARGWDEHPPADVSVGMGIQEELVTALRQSSAWSSSVYVIT